MEFKKYRRTGLSELRELTPIELAHGPASFRSEGISISKADLDAGSPKRGDMVARNPKNHEDQWLVAAKYISENLELVL